MFESMPGYQMLQSMLYAIDKINNDTNILPNVTLGARIYDSCYSQVIGADMTKELIIMTLMEQENEQLVGVIGAHSSDLSKVVADFLRVFEIPQISYGSSASVLSDKTVYSYFFRTVPPDTQQVLAMIDIMIAFNWNYVIVISSDGLYGETGAEEFVKAAKKRGICIALQLKLPAFPSPKEYDDLTQKLNSEPEVRVVVTFVNVRDIRSVLEALHRNNITKQFIWIGSDGWANNLNAIENYEDYVQGAITLSQHVTPVVGFREYFQKLNVYEESNWNNTWLQEYWQTYFHCRLRNRYAPFSRNCTGNESLASSPVALAPVQTVVNAVYAFAHALHNYLKNRCLGNSCERVSIDRTILLDYLQNVSFNDVATGKKFEFNDNQEVCRGYSIHNIQKREGKFVYEHVGNWSKVGKGLHLNLTSIKWPNDSRSPPVSVCSHPCKNGYFRQKKGSHDIACCWNCLQCKSHEIVKSSNESCASCPFGEVPNNNQSDCIELPYVTALSQGSSQAILSVSMIGLFLVTCTAVIFFSNGNMPLIKASSRELSGIILVGLAFMFVFPWFLFAEPTTALCICQPLILGFSLSACYAPLFMKLLRIYRIFKAAQQSAEKPILISPSSQVLISLGLIVVQVLFSCISFFPSPPKPVFRVIHNGHSLFVECSTEKDIFATLLSYNMFLMLLCTLMAFKTRKFPRNFNEAKFIGFTMYFTCFVWIIFFPSYLSSANGLDRIIWESGAVNMIGWITLFGLFGPKIFHLVLRNHLSSSNRETALTTNSVSQAAVVTVSTDTSKNILEKVKAEVENKSSKDSTDDKNEHDDQITPF
ncbi:metabotropic glutamate receptor 4-like isoform X2 [Xenia sp. Carnegie-2017]|nr:metabotropic glutamate receptor 4-like isoform X2 [Xenia sp. Carnegie-2017]